MLVLIIGGVLLLTIIIIVHELGHLLLGKLVGVQAEIFSIGYGKGIIKKKMGSTIFQITAFPLGGYVKFKGDDYAVDYSNDFEGQKDSFFSKPPLLRIIPVLGGPLFNLLFGILIFFIVGFFPTNNPPIIYFWEELENSPAKVSGLQNGDRVLEVNNKQIKNFRELQEHILLSGGSTLNFKIERNSEVKEIQIIPDTDPAGRSYIGIRVPGERYIQVDFPFLIEMKYRIFQKLNHNLEPSAEYPALQYLHDGDVLLEVEGKPITSVFELQKFLGNLEKDTVTLKIRRLKYPLLIPWFTEIQEIQVPFRKEYKVYLRNVLDIKYKESIPQIELVSYSPEHLRLLNFIKVEKRPISSFRELHERFSKISEITINIEDKEYKAQIIVEKIGLIGFRPNSFIETMKTKEDTTILGSFLFSLESTFNHLALYPKFLEKLFLGRISFIDNTMGPVGMFAIAGMVMQTDFIDYLQLMASISIALMVVNLIPFPIVDGGHIVLFLIEAIRRKKLPLEFIDTIHKFSFLFLMGLGLWIMFKDILFVLGL